QPRNWSRKMRSSRKRATDRNPSRVWPSVPRHIYLNTQFCLCFVLKTPQLRHHAVITAVPYAYDRIESTQFCVIDAHSSAAIREQRRNCVELSSYLHRGVDRRDAGIRCRRRGAERNRPIRKTLSRGIASAARTLGAENETHQRRT